MNTILKSYPLLRSSWTHPSPFQSTASLSSFCFYNTPSPVSFAYLYMLKATFLSTDSLSRTTLLQKLIRHPHKSSTVSSSSVRAGALWASSISLLECWLDWSCTDNHRYCEFRNAAAISCPEHAILQKAFKTIFYDNQLLTIFIPILPRYSLGLGAEGMIQIPHLGLSKSHLLPSFWPLACFWINHYLLDGPIWVSVCDHHQ